MHSYTMFWPFLATPRIRKMWRTSVSSYPILEKKTPNKTLWEDVEAAGVMWLEAAGFLREGSRSILVLSCYGDWDQQKEKLTSKPH